MMTRFKWRGKEIMMNKKSILGLAVLGTVAAAPVWAQEAAAPVNNAFIFNTLLFLIGGFLVFWMAAGFAMLEAGLVRSKNVTM
jgi:Amt family ammonium transporter